MVPGLSAYQATASALSAELTIPGVVQTIVLSRAGGRTGVPEAEDLSNLARLKASLCLYLSAPGPAPTMAMVEGSVLEEEVMWRNRCEARDQAGRCDGRRATRALLQPKA